jgi:hypothetical protein
MITRIIKKIIRPKQTFINFYKNELSIWKTKFVQPGHYYSPNVDHNWINQHSESVFI